jgi:sugar phosphate permease
LVRPGSAPRGSPRQPGSPNIAKYCPANITGTMGGLAMGIAGLIGQMGLKASATIQQTPGYQLTFNMMAGIAVLGILSVLFLRPFKKNPEKNTD